MAGAVVSISRAGDLEVGDMVGMKSHSIKSINEPLRCNSVDCEMANQAGSSIRPFSLTRGGGMSECDEHNSVIIGLVNQNFDAKVMVRQLTAERDRYRAALEKIDDWCHTIVANGTDDRRHCWQITMMCDKALEGEDGK
jgi:hypothetical protein